VALVGAQVELRLGAGSPGTAVRLGAPSPLEACDRRPTDGEDDGDGERGLGDQIATSLKRASVALTYISSSQYV
jgi:hypothetical protein